MDEEQKRQRQHLANYYFTAQPDMTQQKSIEDAAMQVNPFTLKRPRLTLIRP